MFPQLLTLLRKRPTPVTPPATASGLPAVRSALRQCVSDCHGKPMGRLAVRIDLATSHRDLWALRTDAYNLIATCHCQSVATERIRALSHLFDGRIDITARPSGAPSRRTASAAS